MDKSRGITRQDLWDKALEEVSKTNPNERGIWALFLVWQKYWNLLREAEKPKVLEEQWNQFIHPKLNRSRHYP